MDDAIAGLPPLRDEIAAAGLRAQKALGQNFLLDLNLLDRIVRAVPLAAGDGVYEVGPGPGGLTRALLKAGAHVVAVERDRRAIPVLDRLAALSGGRLRVVEGDAMAADAAGLMREVLAGGADAHCHIVANLPYNIATPLLIGWLSAEPWPGWWQSATLMFQKEVADRIVAAANTPAYGRLSILAQTRCAVRVAMTLPARAFTPPPKVASAVVSFVPRSDGMEVPLRVLGQVTAAAFGQRRKMLRQSLRAVPGALDALAVLGVDPAVRAETLPVSVWGKIAMAVAKSPERNSG